VYGQVILGFLAAIQSEREPLKAVYLSSIMTSFAIAVSALVKSYEGIMSGYHIHIVIVYLCLLGAPMVTVSIKLACGNFSTRYQLPQLLWSLLALGFVIYACAAPGGRFSELETCKGVSETYLLRRIESLAIAIDTFAVLFVVAVWIDVAFWAYKDVHTTSFDDRPILFALIKICVVHLKRERSIRPFFLAFCLILLPLNEALRAIYGRILNQQLAENIGRSDKSSLSLCCFSHFSSLL
jgi:hypothetical protein